MVFATSCREASDLLKKLKTAVPAPKKEVQD